MDILEERIKKIEERNLKVEVDKAWETSWTRRLCVAIFTYLAISLYMLAVDIDRPWLNAIVPTVGFMISTLAIQPIKNIWIKINKK
ncbi:MAG: hypothetical protein WC518_00840 [Patescibacteria group bacterium]